MSSKIFVDFVAEHLRKNKLVKDTGNLPECFASIFAIEMAKKGFLVITNEQMIRLLQNHSMWQKTCLNRKQLADRKRAIKFMEEIGIQ